MKIPITIKVDHNKKQLFESTKQIHGLNFTDALDEVITKYLTTIDPSELIKLEIEKAEENLNELRENLVKVENLQKQTEYNSKPTENSNGQLTKFREEKYKENKRGLKVQIKNNSISWKTVAEVFMFKNKIEAQAWILEKIEQEKE